MERKEWLCNRVSQLSDRYIFGELSTEEIKEYGELRRELQEIINQGLIAVDKIKQEQRREMRRRRARGKYGEKKIAKELDAVRFGGKAQADVVQQGLFSYEVKYLKESPKFLDKLMTQAERLKRQDTVAVGVVVDRETRLEYYVLLGKDWKDLHGKEISNGTSNKTA